MESKIKSLISSRRFWVSVGGVIAVALQETLGLSEGQTQMLVGVLVAWVVGDSLDKTV
tara:strand:- start:925 stop:1098 length:174 start_codon:yes stop_codon:yes gene_type:complete